MRIFIAIDLDQAKDHFKSIQENIKFPKSKISFTGSYHITLRFFADYDLDKIPLLVEDLKKIKMKRFSIRLSGIGYFGSRRSPRVIWQGCESECIEELKDRIDEKIRVGPKRDHDFKAHVTLARIREYDSSDDLLGVMQGIKAEEIRVDIDRFKLFESVLTPQGPVYRLIEEFRI